MWVIKPIWGSSAVLGVLIATTCASDVCGKEAELVPWVREARKAEAVFVGVASDVRVEEVRVSEEMINVLKKQDEIPVAVPGWGQRHKEGLSAGDTCYFMRVTVKVEEPLKGNLRKGQELVVDLGVVKDKKLYFKGDSINLSNRAKFLGGKRAELVCLMRPEGGINYRPLLAGVADETSEEFIAAHLNVIRSVLTQPRVLLRSMNAPQIALAGVPITFLVSVSNESTAPVVFDQKETVVFAHMTMAKGGGETCHFGPLVPCEFLRGRRIAANGSAVLLLTFGPLGEDQQPLPQGEYVLNCEIRNADGKRIDNGGVSSRILIYGPASDDSDAYRVLRDTSVLPAAARIAASMGSDEDTTAICQALEKSAVARSTYGRVLGDLHAYALARKGDWGTQQENVRKIELAANRTYNSVAFQIQWLLARYLAARGDMRAATQVAAPVWANGLAAPSDLPKKEAGGPFGSGPE